MSGNSGEQQVAAIARDCGDLATAIATARRAIAAGGQPDLEPLVERLRALLDAIDAAPGTERHHVLPQLMGLAEEIEALGGTIAAECRRCSEELAKGEASARAAAAYAKTDLN